MEHDPKSKRSRTDAANSETASGGSSGSKKQATGSPRRKGRRKRSRPVLRFVLLFGLFLGLFELVFVLPVVKNQLFPAYLRWNAVASGALLGIFEDSVVTHGNSIAGRYSLTIERGCDALDPSALFLAGVLAFPSALMAKLPGMFFGTLCLMALNLVRIASLYYIGVYIPSWFHIMHVDVWQAAFILIAIVFWVLWALWAIRKDSPVSHATAHPH